LKIIKKYLGDLFLNQRFFAGLAVSAGLFICGFFIPILEPVAMMFFLIFIAFCLADYGLLFFANRVPQAHRTVPVRLSNGEENEIELTVRNSFFFPVSMIVIDELPIQLQIRNWKRKLFLKPGERIKLNYQFRPLKRGEYLFGDIHLYVYTPLRVICRKFSVNAETIVPVYPAFFQLKKYELLSNATLVNESGTKRIKKIGQSMEFEQIKEYVSGDDIRTLNWKASARKGGLMVNNFMEERSQQVYCIIDKGRLMKMPFDGLTLLDYAINSALVLSGVSLKKQDRVGLITFSNTIDTLLAADRKATQKETILKLLYKQETGFLETDFELLYREIRNRIRHRSLLILFTNFETVSGLHRQIVYLRALAKHHLLLVVFFENTELSALTEKPIRQLEDVYIKTIAEKFQYEKRLIAKELSKFGILSILTPPEKLTVNTINKYLELKIRQAI
jgi:uncharacterized protein (DUF58 family)